MGSVQPQATGNYYQQQQQQQQQQPQPLQQQQQQQQPANAMLNPNQPQGFNTMNNLSTPALASNATQAIQPQGTGSFYGNMNIAMSMPNIMQPQVQQPQATGMYAPTTSFQQPQPQQTQFQAPAVQQVQAPPVQQIQPQNTMQPLLPQQTGFYVQQSQVPLEPLKPTATGFINSFANNGVNKEIKIPTMRLSFITAQDQAKFETLFRAVVKNSSNTISGADCRSILMKSGLQPTQLAKIWNLCDTSKSGELLFPEFALAMHLINDVLLGDSIPYELDSKTKNEIASFINAINVGIATEQNKTPFDDLMNQGCLLYTSRCV